MSSFVFLGITTQYLVDFTQVRVACFTRRVVAVWVRPFYASPMSARIDTADSGGGLHGDANFLRYGNHRTALTEPG